MNYTILLNAWLRLQETVGKYGKAPKTKNEDVSEDMNTWLF